MRKDSICSARQHLDVLCSRVPPCRVVGMRSAKLEDSWPYWLPSFTARYPNYGLHLEAAGWDLKETLNFSDAYRGSLGVLVEYRTGYGLVATFPGRMWATLPVAITSRSWGIYAQSAEGSENLSAPPAL